MSTVESFAKQNKSTSNVPVNLKHTTILNLRLPRRLQRKVCVTSIYSGTKPGFESAAFPHGLPEALETSVAIQNSADGASSDSDHGGMQLLLCDLFPFR